MKKSNYLVLATIFLIFAILYIFQQSSKQTYTVSDTPKFSIINEETAISTITGISFFRGSNSEQSVLLNKKDDIWRVTSLFNSRATKSMIENFLTSIKQVKGDLRSETSDVFAEYGIDDNSALHVTLSNSSGSLAHFLVATKVVEGKNGFLRMNGENNVYYINRNFNSPIGLANSTEIPKGNKWVDLVVFSPHYKLDKKNITGFNVKLEKYGGSYKKEVSKESKDAIEKDNLSDIKFEWILADKNETIDDAKIDRILGNLLKLRASKVLDPATTITGFPYYIEIVQAGEAKQVLQIGKIGDNFYVNVKGDNQIFEVSGDNKILTAKDF